MALETQQFEFVGKCFRTKLHPAVPGLKVLYGKNEHPVDVLRFTEVLRDGEWHKLDNATTINEHLKDPAKIIPPLMLLEEMVRLVKGINFGFLSDWEGARVPQRFITQSKTVTSQYNEPIVSNLIQADKATLMELETHYSTEDAFKLFDIVLVDTINKAYANEDAQKAAKNRK